MMRATFQTDWLTRVLALQPHQPFLYREPARLTPEEEASETARLNALPRDEQTVLFCRVMEVDPLDYLLEKARWQSEVENEIEWLELPCDA